MKNQNKGSKTTMMMCGKLLLFKIKGTTSDRLFQTLPKFQIKLQIFLRI